MNYTKRLDKLIKERNNLLRWRKESDNFIGDNTNRDLLFNKIDTNTNKLNSLQDEIKANGCNKLWDNVKLCGNESWLMKEWGAKLCPACQSLIKQIEELLK